MSAENNKFDALVDKAKTASKDAVDEVSAIIADVKTSDTYADVKNNISEKAGNVVSKSAKFGNKVVRKGRALIELLRH